MKYIYILLIVLIILPSIVEAQTYVRIRKDYREMTSQEKLNYVNALNQLNNNSSSTTLNSYNVSGIIDTYKSIHNIDYGHHGDEPFFPWHRQFLYDFETELRSKNVKISIPYWDWRYDRTSDSSWFWGTDANFLEPFDNAWSLGRSAMTASWLPTATDVSIDQSYTDFGDFWPSSEGTHGTPHVWVGGEMGYVDTSPKDPIFYIHHAMVDRLWQIWEDANTGTQSIFTTSNTQPLQPSGIYASSLVDSRSLKVWYAEHNSLTGSGKLTLNGYNEGTYSVSGTEDYRYTGEIEATKFTVPNGTNCSFVTSGIHNGDAITLSPGFHAISGSVFYAAINSSFFTSARVASMAEEENLNLEAIEGHIQAYSSEKIVTIFLNMPDGSRIDEVSICDLLGKYIYTSSGDVIKSNNSINLNQNPTGIYIIRALVDGSIKYKKFILQ